MPASAQEPLVSVIMNCYNGERYLRQAVESVLAQSYQNWEVIFWDNQSTDRSAEIFRSYDDPRLRYFLAPTHTVVYEARNHAIAQARGEFIAFLDVDDWWLPQKLSTQIPLFDDRDVGIVCGDYWIVHERKNRRWRAFSHPVPTGAVLDELLKSYYVGLLTLVIRRSALALLDFVCNPRYHVIGDYDLVIRLALDWKLNAVQEPIAVCRRHDASVMATFPRRHIDELAFWLESMSDQARVRSSPSFRMAQLSCVYQEAMFSALQSDKKTAWRLSRRLPWGALKARVWLAVLLPAAILARVKN